MNYWIETSRLLPPAGEVVETISPHGLQQTLKRGESLWFEPDSTFYVYYTPQFWRPIVHSEIRNPQSAFP